MKTGLCVFLAAAVFFDFSSDAEAGEIIKKTYYDSKGRAVGKYVYQAGSSRRSYARASRVRYPVYRPGYVHPGPVYSPAVYRVYRPMALSHAAYSHAAYSHAAYSHSAYSHAAYSHGVYHAGWTSRLGYRGTASYFSAPVHFRLVSPHRYYY